MFRYSHINSILNKIFAERPANPLEMFEKYSRLIKRKYNMREQINFEKVFVDIINRNDCCKNLLMYKVLINRLTCIILNVCHHHSVNNLFYNLHLKSVFFFLIYSIIIILIFDKVTLS